MLRTSAIPSDHRPDMNFRATEQRPISGLSRVNPASFCSPAIDRRAGQQASALMLNMSLKLNLVVKTHQLIQKRIVFWQCRSIQDN